MRGRVAFVYHVSTVDTSVASTLLPAVIDRIFVENRDFYTPPALHTAVNFNSFE